MVKENAQLFQALADWRTDPTVEDDIVYLAPKEWRNERDQEKLDAKARMVEAPETLRQKNILEEGQESLQDETEE